MHPRKIRTLVVVLLAFMLAVQCVVSASAISGGVSLHTVIVDNDIMGSIKLPSGIFFDEKKERLYVADTGNNRLISFDKDFGYLSELSLDGIELPLGLVKDSGGRFYVINGQTGKIVLIDVANRVVEPLVFKNIPGGEADFIPGSIAIDGDDRLYMTDRLNGRVIVAGVSGEFIREVGIKGPERNGHSFRDVKVDAEGNIYTVDTVAREVAILNKNGDLMTRFGGAELFDFPVSVAPDGSGLVYVLDRHKGKVFVFDRKGKKQFAISRSGPKEGELNYPSYLYIDGNMRLYVADANRIQIYIKEE